MDRNGLEALIANHAGTRYVMILYSVFHIINEDMTSLRRVKLVMAHRTVFFHQLWSIFPLGCAAA